MSKAAESEKDERVTRAEAAEYLHDMAGQLAAMAEQFGLTASAEALRHAQLIVEREF